MYQGQLDLPFPFIFYTSDHKDALKLAFGTLCFELNCPPSAVQRNWVPGTYLYLSLTWKAALPHDIEWKLYLQQETTHSLMCLLSLVVCISLLRSRSQENTSLNVTNGMSPLEHLPFGAEFFSVNFCVLQLCSQGKCLIRKANVSLPLCITHCQFLLCTVHTPVNITLCQLLLCIVHTPGKLDLFDDQNNCS